VPLPWAPSQVLKNDIIRYSLFFDRRNFAYSLSLSLRISVINSRMRIHFYLKTRICICIYVYIYIYIAKNTWNGTALIINELIIRREIFCHLKEVIRFFVFFLCAPNARLPFYRYLNSSYGGGNRRNKLPPPIILTLNGS